MAVEERIPGEEEYILREKNRFERSGQGVEQSKKALR